MKSSATTQKIKRLTPPVRKKLCLRILLPVLLLTWLVCYIATLNAGTRTFRETEDKLTWQRSMITARLSEKNSHYSECLKDPFFDPDMTYARYFHYIQLQLREWDPLSSRTAAIICNTDDSRLFDIDQISNGSDNSETPDEDDTSGFTVTITVPVPELIDVSEPKLFTDVIYNYMHPEKYPDFRSDLICYSDMDEEYDRFLETVISASGSDNIRMHIAEMYVNWETWEFIPKVIYCYLDPFPIYRTTITPPENFTLVVDDEKTYTKISPSLLGTGSSGTKALEDLKNNYPFEIYASKYDSVTYCNHTSRIVQAISNVTDAFAEANRQTFGTNKLRRTVPISMYDADGNLDTYYLTQEIIYRYPEFYGRRLFFAWFFATVLALALGGLTAELIYRKRLNIWQTESYRRNLTNTMAHDLKSPLMAMMGYAENLKEKTHPEKADYYAQEIIRCTEYMNGIIADLLDLGKLEEICIVTEQEPVDLAALLAKIAGNYQTVMEQKKLAFSAEGTATVTGDRKMLFRAFDCLINNAVNYTPEGNDIRITITENQVIITNRGISLSKKMCKKVFEPFVKQDQARTDQKGSGLGLSIAKEIFSAHGMTCRMESGDNAVSVVVTW